MARSLDILRELEDIGALGASKVTREISKPVVSVKSPPKVEAEICYSDAQSALDADVVKQVTSSLAHGLSDLQESLESLLRICEAAKGYFQGITEDAASEQELECLDREDLEGIREELAEDMKEVDEILEDVSEVVPEVPEEDDSRSANSKTDDEAVLGEEGLKAWEREEGKSKTRREKVSIPPGKNTKTIEQIKQQFLDPDALVMGGANGSGEDKDSKTEGGLT